MIVNGASNVLRLHSKGAIVFPVTKFSKLTIRQGYLVFVPIRFGFHIKKVLRRVYLKVTSQEIESNLKIRIE